MRGFLMPNTLTHHQTYMEKRLRAYHQLDDTNLRTSEDNWRLAGLLERVEEILEREDKRPLKQRVKA